MCVCEVSYFSLGNKKNCIFGDILERDGEILFRSKVEGEITA
jgi:hypothetical protein